MKKQIERIFSPSICYSHGKGGNYGKDQIDCSIRRCTYGSKKSIYAAEYGYDMNNNVSKFTSSTGGVSMTGVRHKNGSTTTDYYFVCNLRGNIISIFGGAVEDELLNLMGR